MSEKHERRYTPSAKQAPPGSTVDLAHLVDGYLSTQLLYVAVKLGVADLLAAGPRSSAEIAAAVGADHAALARVLRGLAADGVLDEDADGRYRLNAVGDKLRDGTVGSVRGLVLARGEVYFTAAAGLLDAVLDGGVAFERVHGEEFFAYLSSRSEESAAFQASMSARSRQEAEAVVAAYDFGAFSQIVDVGGGTGVLLARILTAHAGARGVLVDRSEVVGKAAETLGGADVSQRVQIVAGDFFVNVPPGGDAYLLSRVLHDWDDVAAAKILATCHRAMPAGGRLVLVEVILPERAVDQPAAVRMDLHMLLLLRGRERTAAEFERLLGKTGFALARVVDTESPAGISVIEAIRDDAGHEI